MPTEPAEGTPSTLTRMLGQQFLALTQHQSIKCACSRRTAPCARSPLSSPSRALADVIIDDVRVVTVSIALKLLVVVYIVYSIFWLKNFMAIETPIGVSNVWAGGFASGDTSMLPKGMCNASSRFDFVYDSAWAYRDNRCRTFGYGEVIRKRENGIYVQTYTTDSWYENSGCHDDGRECAVSSVTSSNFYVPGVDGIVFGFDHGFTTPLGYFDQRNPKALLMTEDGETKRRVPAGAPLSVSLSELLDLAGVGSLDDDNVAGEVAESIGTPLFRMTGLLLEINIFYTNLMLLDEDKLNGRTTVAEITVKKGITAWSAAGGDSDFVSPGVVTENCSMAWHERYSYGVNVQVTFSGAIGRFSMFALLVKIAEFIVFFGAGKIAADIVAQ